LVVQPFGDDHVGYGEERRRVRRRADEDVLVRQRVARARLARIDADDADAVLLGSFRYWKTPVPKVAVAGLQPHMTMSFEFT
jgi:hypothetical protein